jgi:hypothetical protein
MMFSRAKASYFLGKLKQIRLNPNDKTRSPEQLQVLYCLGDSHTKMFEYLHTLNVLKKTTISCCTIGGATALGLVNPNSKTNALQILRKQISSISRKHHLLFMLGEVDCGFVIWYRAAKYQIPVEVQFEQSLENYQEFVLSTYAKGYHRIILSCVPLPTIYDGQDWGVIANARSEVKATLLQRTELTCRYNDRLRSFCDNHDLKFLDFREDMLDTASNLLKPELRNSDPFDHHLSSEAMTPILTQKLNYLGFY